MGLVYIRIARGRYSDGNYETMQSLTERIKRRAMRESPTVWQRWSDDLPGGEAMSNEEFWSGLVVGASGLLVQPVVKRALQELSYVS